VASVGYGGGDFPAALYPSGTVHQMVAAGRNQTRLAFYAHRYYGGYRFSPIIFFGRKEIGF
jgi:hypothetical protein